MLCCALSRLKLLQACAAAVPYHHTTHDKNTDKSLTHRHVLYCNALFVALSCPVCRWWFHYKHLSQMSVHVNTTVKRGLNNTLFLNTLYTCESWLGNVQPQSPPHSAEAWNSSPSPYLYACPCTCPWSQSARRSCRTAQRWASGPFPPDCVGSARWRVWWRRAPSLGRWCGESQRHCLGQDARWTCREWTWVRERERGWRCGCLWRRGVIKTQWMDEWILSITLATLLYHELTKIFFLLIYELMLIYKFTILLCVFNVKMDMQKSTLTKNNKCSKVYC